MKRIFFFLVLPAALLIADEHAIVNSRPISPDLTARMQSERESEQAQNANSATDHNEEIAGYYLADYPPVYFPPSCHWLGAISALSDSLQIEDGSMWQIDPYDAYKIRNWFANDPLIVTQNRSWFSTYQYRIINQNTGYSIDVNLIEGPVLNGEYSRQIAALDTFRGEIVLTDNTRWTISRRDAYLLPTWERGDYIITGINSGWDSDYNCILIDVATNNFVRAKQF
jgi:hypothetical protein